MKAVVYAAFFVALFFPSLYQGAMRVLDSSLKIAPVVAIFFLSLVGVGADCLIKLASKYQQPMRTAYFWSGASMYFLMAFGWVFTMRYVKLGSLGVLYSFSTSSLLILSGVLFFRENLTGAERIGLVFGFISVALLSRFV